MRDRRLVLTMVLATLGLLVAWFALSGKRDESAAHVRQAPVAAAPVELPRPAPPRFDAPPLQEAAPPAAIQEPEARVEAFLDKTSVCRGEENFVNVRLAGGTSLDPEQTAYVAVPGAETSVQGLRVPFRMRAATSEPIRVAVESRGLTTQSVELAPPTVKDCAEPTQLSLQALQEIGTFDRPRFFASVNQADPAGRERPFQAERFVWNFGDGGEQVITTVPQIQHSYEARIQDRPFSHYLVTVRALDDRQRVITGSVALALSNPAFRTLSREGRILVLVSIEEDTTVDPPRSRFWLYHGHDQDIEFDSVSMVETAYAPEGGGSTESAPSAMSPEEVLGFTRLEAGERREAVGIARMAATRPGVIRRFWLSGISADGVPVTGRISLAPKLPPS
jgi:hypothetical protein